ncbi:hypothetical protein KG892_03490 [Vermiphilus pyriformis]|nr:MAG: hypothetical protein KG892_03490 [Vermiphilus pyriformis]
MNTRYYYLIVLMVVSSTTCFASYKEYEETEESHKWKKSALVISTGVIGAAALYAWIKPLDSKIDEYLLKNTQSLITEFKSKGDLNFNINDPWLHDPQTVNESVLLARVPCINKVTDMRNLKNGGRSFGLVNAALLFDSINKTKSLIQRRMQTYKLRKTPHDAEMYHAFADTLQELDSIIQVIKHCSVVFTVHHSYFQAQNLIADFKVKYASELEIICAQEKDQLAKLLHNKISQNVYDQDSYYSTLRDFQNKLDKTIRYLKSSPWNYPHTIQELNNISHNSQIIFDTVKKIHDQRFFRQIP